MPPYAIYDIPRSLRYAMPPPRVSLSPRQLLFDAAAMPHEPLAAAVIAPLLMLLMHAPPDIDAFRLFSAFAADMLATLPPCHSCRFSRHYTPLVISTPDATLFR